MTNQPAQDRPIWVEVTSLDQLRDPRTRIRINKRDSGKTVGDYMELSVAGTPFLEVMTQMGTFLVEVAQ